MKALIISSSLFFGLLFNSCSDDDLISGRSATYVVASNSSSSPKLKGIFSLITWTHPNEITVIDSFAYIDMGSRGNAGTFLDVQKEGNYIYTLNTTGRTIRKISISNSFEVEQSLTIPALGSRMQFICPYESKLVVVGRTDFDATPVHFFTVYDDEFNLLDSINVRGAYSDIFDIIVANNKLFISSRRTTYETNNSLYRIFNLDDGILIKDFDATTVSEFYLSADGEVLAFSSPSMYTIDPITLEITEAPFSMYPERRNGSAIAVGQQDDLFYFQPAAQPAPFPFLLFRASSVTGDSSQLTTIEDGRVSPPILYDPENDLILTAGQSDPYDIHRENLRFFKSDGEIVGEAKLPVHGNVIKTLVMD